MKWTKIGPIFGPDNNYPWMATHAANPTAEHVGGDVFRVYFSPRDRENRSSIGFLEIDLKDPLSILRISQRPVLLPGERGAFDDSGVSMGSLVEVDRTKYLYYVGWNLGVTVPWRNSIGLAIARSGDEEFRKYSPAPIVDRSEVDPYSLSYPWVLHADGRWQMWYGSNLRWGSTQRNMDHVIKYATSDDGVKWLREGTICIGLSSGEEHAIARPCVVYDGGLYRMWYSHRGQAYRIGYAESTDGVRWERKDNEAGITVSPSGWDADMIEYPCVFQHKGRRYMLYNGNGFGKTGFGLAQVPAP